MSSSAAAVLAASDTGKGSPIGLFVVLLLVIAVYLLYRSMTGHLRRLPEKFPGYQGAPGPDEAAAADAAAGAKPADPDAEIPAASPGPPDRPEAPRPDRPA